jgi:hypothetical protein
MPHALKRIDATWTDGDDNEVASITLFAITDDFAQQRRNEYLRMQVGRLKEFGWTILERQEDVSQLSPLERAALIGPIWPLLRLDELVDLIRHPPGDEATAEEVIAMDRKLHESGFLKEPGP